MKTESLPLTNASAQWRIRLKVKIKQSISAMTQFLRHAYRSYHAHRHECIAMLSRIASIDFLGNYNSGNDEAEYKAMA